MTAHRMLWIGCGRHAEQMLLPQLMRHDVELVGVCDLDASAAARIGRRYGVAHVATDHRELLALPGIDVVGMAAGPVAHRDLPIAALERGCHVFMEKPCGASAADAQAIASTAAAAGRTVGGGFMKRFSTANRIAYNIVKSPEFGPVAGFFGVYMTAPTYFAGSVDYRNFYLHHCVHYMDLVRYFVAPVEQVTVFRHEPAPGKLLLHVHFGFANGAIGTVVLGTLQSRGTPMERLQSVTLADGVDTLAWKPNFTAAANEDFKGYNALFGAFFAQFDGQVTDLPTIDDGVLAMRVLEAVIAGSESPGVAIRVAAKSAAAGV